jgi:hypothetical protein
MSASMAPPDAGLIRFGKSFTPAPVKSGLKSALRMYGIATTPLRGKPDFLIIGAKRCGSTSLYHWLLDHPQVAPLFPTKQHIKGIHWFDRQPHRSLRWYRSYFPVRARFGASLAGEASPYYLIHPQAAARAAAAVGDAKIIVLVREPAARAYSQWRDEVRLGHEHLSFADALAAEDERLEPELRRMRDDPTYYSWIHEHLSYRSWGRYAVHLQRWLSEWAPAQVLVVCTEELLQPGSSTPGTITDFLGLRAHPNPALPWLNASAPPSEDDAAVFAELRSSYASDNAALRKLFPAARITWT